MNINKTFRLAAISAAIAMVSGLAMADEIQLKLTGSQEVPPVTTQAAGSGVLTISKDMSVGGGIATTGVAGTMAHIHVGKAGSNGPVAVTLTKSGSDGWRVPPDAKLTEAQYQAYLAGELYVNVHSEAHKGGEIRGQLMPPANTATRMPGY